MRSDKGTEITSTPNSAETRPTDWYIFSRAVCDEIASVRIEALLPADSPRLSGEDAEHVRLLAESDALPPIVVHRDTMRVIDGMHRLRAAQLRGVQEIAVRYFDGTDDLPFILAVHANTAHGLPLSLADRKAAAARIIQSHPHWSDRVIGVAAGLATNTVSAIRHQIGGEIQQPLKRLGRDGRVRPLSTSEGRQRAIEVIAEHPEASLRQIAKLAGISLGTAKDVREKLHRNIDPIPARQRTERTCGAPRRVGAQVLPSDRRESIVRTLFRDPSLRLSENGRAVLRCIGLQVSGLAVLQNSVDSLPLHSAYNLIELASGIAAEWLDFADKLQQRSDITT